jgi:hypothetical protein
MLTEVGDRGQFYPGHQSGFFLSFAWQLSRAWFVNLIWGQAAKPKVL